MSFRSRLTRLEDKLPRRRVDNEWPPVFSKNLQGMKRSEAQQERIDFLRAVIADKRCSDDLKAECEQAIASTESALRQQLESEKGRCCPKCDRHHFIHIGEGRSKCENCGRLVRIRGDGIVTDAETIR